MKLQIDAPLSQEQLGEKVGKILAPGAPDRLRNAFAKGVIPGLLPAELISGLYHLAILDVEFNSQIKETLKELPDSIINGAVKENLPPQVFHYLSYTKLENETVEIILKNNEVHDETIARFAKFVIEKLALIIADNHTRLLRYPDIIENLYLNKATPMSVATKIIELAARNKVELGMAAYKEMVKALDLDPVEDDPLDAEFAAIELDEKFASIEHGKFVKKEYDKKGDEIEIIETEEDVEIKKKGHNISKLPVSARIRLAQLGNRFHRAQLIRDANKVVCMAVIKSPAISEAEIEEYSKNKQLSEDIIRYIARRKDWVKRYRVKLNLVNNPKTPITTSLTLLNYVRVSDLRILSRSRNVSPIVRQAAKQKMKQRK
jgi:hypothetical protein